MPRRPYTREECRDLYKRYSKLPGPSKVTLDKIAVELGHPGNATEVGRYFKGYRDSIPGGASPDDLWNAIERAKSKPNVRVTA